MGKTFAALIIILSVLLSGCATLVQKAGELLEGNAFNEKTISIYRNDNHPKKEMRIIKTVNDENEMVISCSQFPGLKIYADYPENNKTFQFKRAYILSTHVHGWNEFSIELAGEGIFNKNDAWGIFNIEQPPLRLSLIEGKIRYKDSRIVSNQALNNLNDRRERIIVLADWMKDRIKNDPVEFSSQKEFEKYWKNILFNRNPPETDRLPEINPDSLLRDWEEAVSWIYIEYMWDNIFKSFNQNPFYKMR